MASAKKGAASAAPTIAEHCPAAMMATEYERLDAEHDRLDRLPSGTEGRAASYDRVGARMDALHVAMAAVQATSVAGALAQLALAYSMAEACASGTATDDYMATCREALPGLLYSAANAIANHHGIDACSSRLSARHMPRFLDPFAMGAEHVG